MKKTDIFKRIVCYTVALVLCFVCISFSDRGADAATVDKITWVKVTEEPASWDGTYLIVYEAGSVAFDGSLEKLDSAENNFPVVIENGVITDNNYESKAFTISSLEGGYSIQATNANSDYISQDSDANGMEITSTASVNTISMNDDKTVNIIGSGGAYLRYNKTSNQVRFRYYKTSSYTSMQPITLYKKTVTQEEVADDSIQFTGTQTLELRDRVHIRYYLELKGVTVDSSTECGMQWRSTDPGQEVAKDLETTGGTIVAGFQQRDSDGKYFVSTGGINAPDISKTQYYRAYIKIGDTYFFTDVCHYSVSDYLNEVAIHPSYGTDSNLYKAVAALIEYGQYAELMFAEEGN